MLRVFFEDLPYNKINTTVRLSKDFLTIASQITDETASLRNEF